MSARKIIRVPIVDTVQITIGWIVRPFVALWAAKRQKNQLDRHKNKFRSAEKELEGCDVPRCFCSPLSSFNLSQLSRLLKATQKDPNDIIMS
jgi:hypothetical protein